MELLMQRKVAIYSAICVQKNTALIHNGVVIVVYFIPSDHVWLVESGVCVSNKVSLYFCLFVGNLTKHMKSKSHGKKCQAMGVSESSVDEPESEETGTGWGTEPQLFHRFPRPPRGREVLAHHWTDCRRNVAARC